MKLRQFLLTSALLLSLAVAGCSGNSGPRHYTVSADKLQQIVSAKFPKDYPVAGLLQLQLQAPAIKLLADQNLINAVMQAQLSGGLLKRSYAGQLDVNFAMRYNPADRTVRAHQIKVNALTLDELPPALADMLNTYGGTLAQQALNDVVLYQLQDKDLAAVDALNMQPGAITVTPQGLQITLMPKGATQQ